MIIYQYHSGSRTIPVPHVHAETVNPQTSFFCKMRLQNRKAQQTALCSRWRILNEDTKHSKAKKKPVVLTEWNFASAAAFVKTAKEATKHMDGDAGPRCLEAVPEHSGLVTVSFQSHFSLSPKL